MLNIDEFDSNMSFFLKKNAEIGTFNALALLMKENNLKWSITIYTYMLTQQEMKLLLRET
jgi:hypothetical protein